MTLYRFTVASALALALRPVAAVAQQPAPRCEIDEKKPGQVKDAASALTRAMLPIGSPADKLKSVTQAIGLLHNKEPEKVIAANALGRAYVLGKAYAIYAEMSAQGGNDHGFVVPRSALGITVDPTATIDLVAAVDSSLDAVEASNAACRDDNEEYRRRLYAPLINAAVNLFNQQQLDSAGALVRRGLQVYDGYRLSYIAYNLLGNVQQSRSEMDAAVASFQRMADLMKGDTSQVNERQNVMWNVAQLMLSMAEEKEEARAERFKAAGAYLNVYRTEYPSESKVMGALARAYFGAGDTASAEALFKELLAGADKYDDNVMFEAGVNASKAKRPDLALPFFNAGLKKNVASREGLFNYVVTLQNLEKWSEVPAVLDRLGAVDPENPDVHQLRALYFQNEAKQRAAAAKVLRTQIEANQKKTRRPPTPAELKPLSDAETLVKVANDSTIKYIEKMQSASVSLSVNMFTHDGTKHTLGGAVENRGAEAKSYTVEFEFLDAAGKPVTSKSVTVEGVASKGSKAFRVEVEGAGVVAYRYKPFSS